MKKITVNGVEFTDFGSNNYSNGMHLITCYPMPDNMVQDVLAGKYENVWLNPSAPCRGEFYGLYGTAEQYAEVKERQEECQISKRLIDILGGFDALRNASKEEYNKANEQARAEYKNWWE